MRRSVLVLAAVALAVLLASGVAWAASINCRAGADRCYGTNGSDTINGSGPRGILGGPGNDTVRSTGATNDTIYVSDGERDTVGCGGGTDTVYFDKGVDTFIDNSSCENRVPR